MSKLTDYGILLLAQLAREKDTSATARDLATSSHVPLPTVGKLLKELLQKGLLVSHRGVNGGYTLARAPEEISVGQIVTALEGPIALTECGTAEPGPGPCQLEPQCPLSGNWKTISQAIRDALEGVSLAQLARENRVRAEGLLPSTPDGTSARTERTP